MRSAITDIKVRIILTAVIVKTLMTLPSTLQAAATDKGKSSSTPSAGTSVGSAAGASAPDPNGNNDDKPTRATNPKHHPNSSSPEPANADELFDKSIPDKSGVRWAKDSDGTIHRFSKPSNGESHWNGSTAGDKPIRMQDIPIEIRREL